MDKWIKIIGLIFLVFLSIIMWTVYINPFEIVVDCDGTDGWVNVDDMFISKQNATKGFKYWVNASPVPTSNSNNGSAVIFL